MILKILTFLTIVTATSPVFSKYVSSVDENIFFDDNLSWMPSNDVQKSDDSSENAVNSINYKICTTKECIAVAKGFLGSMNKSVNPCDDFYEFTCGAWTAKDVIPPTEISWSRMHILMNRLKHRIKEILEAKPEPDDIMPLRQAKQWYRSCMDTESLERRGVKPIISVLKEVGGWPLTMKEDEWDAEKYTWQKVERHYARLTGSPILYSVKRSGRFNRNHLFIGAPDVPLNSLFNVADYTGKVYDRYVGVIEQIANLFTEQNDTVSRKRMIKEIEEIINFEKKISELKEVRFLTTNYDNLTFGQILGIYHVLDASVDPKVKIDWRSMINELSEMANIDVNELKQTLGYDFFYMKGIRELVMNTSTRTIANYIHWNFVSKMLDYTSEWLTPKTFEFYKELHGVKESHPRWKQCVHLVKMPHTAAYAFVNKYFTESTERTTREMIKNIQISLEHEIEKSNWLDQESKEWIKEKLRNIRLFLGFPEWYKNETAVINRYKGLTMGSDFFENRLNYMRYAAEKKLRGFINGDPVDAWGRFDPLEFNAYYIPELNILLAPASVFQSPLFTPDFPKNINYATIGAVLGHEMGHAFDSHSIFYGASLNATRLPDEVLTRYLKHAKCFIEQFAEYSEDSFKTKESKSEEAEATRLAIELGEKTQHENIADTIGLQSAFETFKDIRKKSSHYETRLPGLEEFTEDQLFFLSYASLLCAVDTPEFARLKQIQTKDTHSPGKLRVIGTISNTKAFAKAFNCPVESPMNPSEKCNIWEMTEDEIKETSQRVKKWWEQ